jgi:hypothetical protein
VIVGSLIIALILPFTYDPVTQFVIALPIVVLFELSVVLIRWNHRTTRAQKKDLRIATLVEVLHEANNPVEIVAAPVVATIEIAPEPEVVTESIEPAAIEQTPEPIKTTRRLLVGPSKLSNKAHPQVLDLRNAH